MVEGGSGVLIGVSRFIACGLCKMMALAYIPLEISSKYSCATAALRLCTDFRLILTVLVHIVQKSLCR
jgi:hypothetical protein